MNIVCIALAKKRFASYLEGMKAFLMSMLIITAMTGSGMAADPLAGLQGKSWPVLLFARSRSDASLDKQVDLLRERRPDLSDRDIVVFRTTGNEDTRSAIGYVDLPRNAALELRRRFEPRRNGLTVILVGKDGTEKARWERVVAPQEVFDLIDSMPMRKQETKEPSTETN